MLEKLKEVRNSISDFHRQLKDSEHYDLGFSLSIIIPIIFYCIYVSSNTSEVKTNLAQYLGFNAMFLIPSLHPLANLQKVIMPYLYEDENQKAIRDSEKLFIELEGTEIDPLLKHRMARTLRNMKFEKEDKELYNDFMFLYTLAKKNDVKVDIQQIIDKLDNFIEYEEDIMYKMRTHVINPMLVNLKNPLNTIPIQPVYLEGNPGTGKTKFVRELGKLLNLRISNFVINKNREFSTKVRKTQSRFYNEKETSSVIYDTKIEQGHDFIILFIDELDKNLNEQSLELLLKMISGSENYIEEDSFMRISLNNCLIIAAGNKSLDTIIAEDIMYEPLRSRFLEIHFPDISKDLQLKTITSITKKAFEEKGLDFSDYEENLLKELVNTGGYTGLRELIFESARLTSIELGRHTLPMLGIERPTINTFRKHTKINPKIHEIDDDYPKTSLKPYKKTVNSNPLRTKFLENRTLTLKTKHKIFGKSKRKKIIPRIKKYKRNVYSN